MATDTAQNDEFTAAFARFGADATGDTPPQEPIEEEIPAEPAPAEEPPAEPVPAEPVPEEPAPEEPAPEEPAPKESDDDVIKRLADMLAKQQTPEPQPEPDPTPAPEPELFSAEEKSFLDTYEKEWPDVAKAEALRRRAEYRDLASYMFAEVAKVVQPMRQVLDELATRTHLTDLRSTVEDYDNVRDKVVDWVQKQPEYLRPAYEYVIDKGSPEEVADLVARYKRETGVSQPITKTPKKESELPPATKQAVESLAPVGSKRSAIVQGVDPNDFEGAFAEFAKNAA
jgi:hypothetical protein